MITLIIYALGAALMIAFLAADKRESDPVVKGIAAALWPVLIGSAAFWYVVRAIRKAVRPLP